MKKQLLKSNILSPAQQKVPPLTNPNSSCYAKREQNLPPELDDFMRKIVNNIIDRALEDRKSS